MQHVNSTYTLEYRLCTEAPSILWNTYISWIRLMFKTRISLVPRLVWERGAPSESKCQIGTALRFARCRIGGNSPIVDWDQQVCLPRELVVVKKPIVRAAFAKILRGTLLRVRLVVNSKERDRAHNLQKHQAIARRGSRSCVYWLNCTAQ